jgi:hypothetical protein
MRHVTRIRKKNFQIRRFGRDIDSFVDFPNGKASKFGDNWGS